MLYQLELSWATCFAVLIAASFWDVVEHRIPNKLILLGTLCGFGLSLSPSSIGIGNATLGFATGLVVLIPFYLFRILGAGDVKLLAVVGSFVGFPGVLAVALATGLAGGFLSLLIAFRHQQFNQILSNLQQGFLALMVQMSAGEFPRQWGMVVGPKRLPYALAIGLGTMSYAIFTQL